MTDCAQYSPEWFAARLNKVTASRVADVIAITKTGYGASRANYMSELIVERLTGQSPAAYTNAAMDWGTATEPQARAAYEIEKEMWVSEAGFILHPTILRAGASPDGLIGDTGLLEIKCPNTATHIETLLSGTVPAKYITQMMWQMACTGRQWCDYVSYDPRLPARMRMFIKLLPRDDALIAELEEEVVKFLGELDGKIAALNAAFGDKETTP